VEQFLNSVGLQARGCRQFEAWDAYFARTVSTIEVRPTGGGSRTTSRFADFTNAFRFQRYGIEAPAHWQPQTHSTGWARATAIIEEMWRSRTSSMCMQTPATNRRGPS
jgi:hypothetical protein